MCYNGTFRFKKLDDSFWNGETFRFADYKWGSGISVVPTEKTLSRYAFDALPQVQNEAPV